MKKSINAWSVESSAGFETMFAAVKETGFDGIELNLDREGAGAHSLTMNTTPEEIASIAALTERYGLPVVSISCSLCGGLTGSPEPEDRKRAQDILLRQIELASALGAPGILSVPGGLSESVSLKTAWENSLATYRGLLGDIEQMGIFVGLENVWNRFFTSPFDMIAFIERLGCPYIGAYFDVGNVVAFSEPENWIEILGKNIGLVHVKDFKRRSGANSGGEWVDLLAGSVDWRKVVPALRNAGFDGYLTAEVGKSDPDQSYEAFYAMVAEQLSQIINIS